jgi:hypothetical protein
MITPPFFVFPGNFTHSLLSGIERRGVSDSSDNPGD